MLSGYKDGSSLSRLLETEPYQHPDAKRIAGLVAGIKIGSAEQRPSPDYADRWFEGCFEQAQRDGLFLLHLTDHLGLNSLIHLGCSPRAPQNSPAASFLAQAPAYLGVHPFLMLELPHDPWKIIGNCAPPTELQEATIAYVNADPLDMLSRLPYGDGYSFVAHPFYGDTVSEEYYYQLAREIVRLANDRTIVSGLCVPLFEVLVSEELMGEEHFVIVQAGKLQDEGLYGATLRQRKCC